MQNNFFIFRLSKLQRRTLIIGLLLVVCLMIFISRQHDAKKSRKPTAVAVQVSPVIVRPMAITLSKVGTIESQRTVNVTAQVTGVLKKIAFQAGAEVSKGQLLFVLDHATLSASLQHAQAILQRDQAQLTAKSADAKRYANLVKLEYVTRQQYDEAQSAADAQAAVVASDEAQIREAQIQLGYARISAPVAGKTGNITVKVGDLIEANSTTALVTIRQLKPLFVDFSVDQNQLLTVLHYQQQKPLPVEIYADNQKQLLEKGTLTFIDNTLNQQTGTILLKAQVDNNQRLLWPGMIVTVKLILAIEPQAKVIPISAIQFDEKGAFVYRIEHGKAVVNRVVMARQSGKLAVIKQGLSAGEQVIAIVPPNLNAGDSVRTVTT